MPRIDVPGLVPFSQHHFTFHPTKGEGHDISNFLHVRHLHRLFLLTLAFFCLFDRINWLQFFVYLNFNPAMT